MIIGSGVDIIEVRRLKKAIERWGDEFLKRIFAPEELTNAQNRGSLYQHLAGRFAAKEAIFKALGNKNLTWLDLVIVNDQEGKPRCRILNGKGDHVDVFLSISHVKSYAVANAVITKKA
ncbi:MAG TPA: holo-ACP synthase [Candidatus Omnitrophota bacterium]|nr:holo-ACP synthase [Candidatus Omnitrophota bacterium]